jgi:hypothetical protein
MQELILASAAALDTAGHKASHLPDDAIVTEAAIMELIVESLF